MGTHHEILTHILPDTLESTSITIRGTGRADAAALTGALSGFSERDPRYLLCYLPASWLMCNTPRSRTLREQLLNGNLLEMSVLLPKGIVNEIPGDVGLLVLDKERRNQNKTDVRFLVMRGETWTEALADYRDILLQKMPLIATHYCSSSSTGIERIRETGCLLSEIADIQTAPQTATEGAEYGCLSVSRFSRFGYTESKSIERKFYKKVSEEAFLKEDDLIFVLQGAVGRVAIIGPKPRDCIPAYQTCILRPHTLDPRALYVYLRSEIVRAYVTSCTIGTVQSHRMSLAALKNLPVPKLSDSDQKSMIKTFQEMCDVQRQLDTADSRGNALLKRFFAL